MKKSYTLIILTLITVFSFSSMAQDGTKVLSSITAEDKKAIIAVFKTADQSKYRMKIGGTREVYGTKRITTNETEIVNKTIIPNAGKSAVIFWKQGAIIYFPDKTTIYISATTTRTNTNALLILLGKAQTTKFKDVINKYFVVVPCIKYYINDEVQDARYTAKPECIIYEDILDRPIIKN